MDGRALSPSAGQKNTQHQLMNQTEEQDPPKHRPLDLFSIYTVPIYLWSYGNAQLWFSTQYVPFIVYCLYTTNIPQCSSVRKTYLSEVWRWRTGWRHWAVDSSRRWGRPCSQRWRRMACWSWGATRKKRLTMSHYQQHQTHDDVKLQQRPAAATKHTHTRLKTHPQMISDTPTTVFAFTVILLR